MNYLNKTTLVSCIACALALPAMAVAAENDDMIKASKILYSDISNGLNTFARVDNVLLDKNGESVEYLFFEKSDTFGPATSGKGFVEMSNVDFNPATAGELQVVVKDTDAQRQPQELTVSYSEAESRLVSRVLDQSIRFSDDEARRIDDILIDRDTGDIKYFTVDMATDSFFSDDIRAIPADEVNISWSGSVTSSSSFADISSHSKYRMDSL